MFDPICKDLRSQPKPFLLAERHVSLIETLWFEFPVFNQELQMFGRTPKSIQNRQLALQILDKIYSETKLAPTHAHLAELFGTELPEFLNAVGSSQISPESIKQKLLDATNWWHLDVAAIARFYRTPENVRSDLKDSISQFSSNGAAFDEKGKSAINVAFAIVGAAAVVTSQAVPLILDEKKRFAGGIVLAFAGIALFANCLWAVRAKCILKAYYGFYVASIIDSARKHAAFGVAKHRWHNHVFNQLRKCPRDQDELIEFWCQMTTTLYYNYTRWIALVSIGSFILGVTCVAGSLLIVYPIVVFRN